jgi:hypothetical protein
MVSPYVGGIGPDPSVGYTTYTLAHGEDADAGLRPEAELW